MQETGLVISITEGMEVSIGEVKVKYYRKNGNPKLRIVAPKSMFITRSNYKEKPQQEGVRHESETEDSVDRKGTDSQGG